MLSSSARIPKAFSGLFEPSRYKAYYGGRGSAKSHSFAVALVIQAAQNPLRVLCCREIQKSIKDSVKSLLDDKIEELSLRQFYTSTETEIRGANGSLFMFAGLRSNPDAIKSMEGLDRAWVEEANRVSRRSLDLLIPTVRAAGSELWFSWNPDNELDPVDVMFRGGHPPPDAIIRQVDYRDNPWFPEVLEKERLFDLATDPEKHEHVWLGGYQKVPEGSYYASALSEAAADGRIGRVPYDPHAPAWAAFDLGIGDSTAVWVAQWVGKELHLIDYLENSGVALEWYSRELRNKPYTWEALILPHDARARELGTGKTREEILNGLGWRTVIAPNVGVDDGIESVRAALGSAWFDASKCEDGLRALREYRRNYDEARRVSRGPLHDWTSHAADALRYLIVGRKEKHEVPEAPVYVPRMTQGAWMA